MSPQEGASDKLDLILFKCFIYLSRLWVLNPEGGPSTSTGNMSVGTTPGPKDSWWKLTLPV